MKKLIIVLVIVVSSMLIVACATVPPQEATPPQQDEPAPQQDTSCPVIQTMMETCEDYGIQKKSCEDAEVLIYSKAFSQTGDQNLSQLVGNACFLSCKSGIADIKDIQVLWMDRYGKCY